MYRGVRPSSGEGDRSRSAKPSPGRLSPRPCCGIRTPGLCCMRCVPQRPCGPSVALPHEERFLPSESTFSRAFAEFAARGLATVVHDALVQEHLSTALIGHVSRDATAIQGREKPVKRVKPAK